MADKQPENEREEPANSEPKCVLNSKDLFGERKELVIEHDGERYRLRITRRGKLILQK